MAESTSEKKPYGKPKRSFQGQHMSKKQKKRKMEAPLSITGSHDEVLEKDVLSMIRNQPAIDSDASKPDSALPGQFAEVEVTVTTLSSTGDGLGRTSSSPQIYLVPFSVPGDRVLARVIRHHASPPHTFTDFIRVLSPSPQRDDTQIKCRYFSTCSGCQFQMLPYSAQLAHKQSIVRKAYANFSGLPARAVPAVGDTLGSPLQYGYRTKLTPHFDGPPGSRGASRRGQTPRFETVPSIGFMKKGTRHTLDIEDCPIGTEAVLGGLVRERGRVAENLDKYRRGATILLRESTRRVPRQGDGEEASSKEDADNGTVFEEQGEHMLAKTCVTDNNGTSTEYVGDYMFENRANEFFQNNNSILPSFTGYVREHILPPSTSGQTITNLIDAYSGSGLFAITLSSLFTRTIGIDISEQSISSAMANLRLNGLAPTTSSPSSSDDKLRDIKFLAADAAKLFASVPADFEAAHTAVVLDPPRKGCDEAFLRQLLAFGPARIVYVSCSVHTQARDVGWILRGGAEIVDGEGEAELPGAYTIESLRGFDFFPQTGHVEGVAVLQRKATSQSAAATAAAT